MSRKEKLLRRLFADPAPKDFTWDELKTLMNQLGFVEKHGNGSRRKFYNPNVASKPFINLHKPHPGNELKPYVVEGLKTFLHEQGYY